MFDVDLLSLSLEKNIKNFYEIKKRSTILDLKLNIRKLKSTKLIKMMKIKNRFIIRKLNLFMTYISFNFLQNYISIELNSFSTYNFLKDPRPIAEIVMSVSS